MDAIVVEPDGGIEARQSLRTGRALAAAGWSQRHVARNAGTSISAALAAALRDATGPVWLVEAGAWPASPPMAWPAPSGTGRPLLALGALRDTQGALDARWASLLAATGGALDDPDALSSLPPDALASVVADASLREPLARALEGGRDLAQALADAAREAGARIVRHQPLDVRRGSRGMDTLRVGLVITSLQQGGAERLTRDLALALPHHGVAARLALLGAPARRPFAAPRGTIDASTAGDREQRRALIQRELLAWGADVVHAHLLDDGDLVSLGDWPIVVTVHNTRAGWPAGLQDIAPGSVRAFVACARTVEAEVAAALPWALTRTVWNGVATTVRDEALRARQRAAWRRRLKIAADDVVLLALANPRPQKRLDRLPAVLAAVHAAASPLRSTTLVLAGSTGAGPDAQAAMARWDASLAETGMARHVRFAGAVDDVPGLLAASDVLVSAAAHEGMSLAHLEALAAGVPVVATDVGGTSEIAARGDAVTLLSPDASPADFAAAVQGAATRAAPVELPADFELPVVAAAYARAYRRAVAPPASRDGGLLLVTNNFSTGGAQSSARRLLTQLHTRGVPAHAAVVQEHPDNPTPGRRALQQAGIAVAATQARDAAEAVDAILALVDAHRPAAVVMWNLIPEHKLLLADGLWDTPLFDVSPGVMWFESLERYFQRPRPGLPYVCPRDYGARLAGVIVKYGGEADRAAALLGAPVHVIPNGVPIAATAPASRPQRDGNAPVVFGTAVRLEPRKRLEQLITALRLAQPRLPPHVLRIAGGVESGSEDYVAGLRDAARALPIEWLGEVADPRPFMASLDVFALVAEPAGCPNASLEAMAEGCAVVATDIGGIREQIEDGVSGRVVPGADPDRLADVLVELARRPSLRHALGAGARERVAQRFSVDRMVADYAAVLGLLPVPT